MTKVNSFDSVDELFASLTADQAAAGAGTKAWHRTVQPGEYVVQAVNDGAESYVNYIKIVAPDPEDTLNEWELLGDIYNDAYGDSGEIEEVFRNTLHGRLTADEFEKCRQAGWPASIADMLMLLYGVGSEEKRSIFAWMYNLDGSPALTRNDERVAVQLYRHNPKARTVTLEPGLEHLCMEKWVVVDGRYVWHEELSQGEVMTPAHPRWDEFCDRLDGEEGCNFHKDAATGETVWTCKGGTDKSFATAILASMGGINVPASLEYFEQHGGYCDCEILLNVAAG